MGLDMNLYKETYIGNQYKTPKEQVFVSEPGVKRIQTKRITSIKENVGYWRKANAIHKWFTDNLEDDVDNCRDCYVDLEKMEELLEIVNKTLKASKLVKGKIQNGSTFKDGKEIPIIVEGKYIEDSSVAKELLPTTEGFFFGSTEYNEYYVQDLKDTKKILEKALKEKDGDFYYSASW